MVSRAQDQIQKVGKLVPKGTKRGGEIGGKLMIVFLDIIRLRNVFLGVPRTRQLGITTVSCEHHLFAFYMLLFWTAN